MPYEKSKVTNFGRGKTLSGFEYCHQVSHVAGEVPTASDLAIGEVAVNVTDGVMYSKKTDGTIKKTGIGDAASNDVTYGRKNGEWVDMTSPANLQVNRGTASEVAAYVALAGEPVYDTTSKALHIGDGTTAGGSLIGAKSTVSGGGTDQSIQGGTYSSTASATIGPQLSVWRLTGYQRYEGDPLNSSSPRIRVGTGFTGDSIVLGGHYTATNTNGSVVSGLIRDPEDEIDLAAAIAGVWSIRIELIVRVLEQATVAVSFPSTAVPDSGDLSLTWSLLVAERIA